MKKLILSLFGMMALSSVSAQSLEKMNWFNEPESWKIKDSKTMTMFVTPQSDYWRISHYGFTVYDAWQHLLMETDLKPNSRTSL